MTIHSKAVEKYFSEVLFVFQFYPVCNFGKFINFGLGTVRSERVKQQFIAIFGCCVQKKFLKILFRNSFCCETLYYSAKT